MSASLLPLAGTLLRAPRELTEGDDRLPLATLLPKLIAIAAISAALFGLVIGSYRGGVQYLYAAVKMPMLFALPLLVGLPAVWAIHSASGRVVAYERVVLAAVVGMARATVLAASTGPVLWLIYSLHINYHRAVLLMSATLLLAGGVGMMTMLRLLPGTGAKWLTHAISLGVLGAVLAQSGWLMRPFIARPTTHVTFLRPIESDIFSSLATSSRSARGSYTGWRPRHGGLLSSEREQEDSP